MRIFGIDITRTRRAKTEQQKQLVPVSGHGGWLRILEPFTGAWQRNIEWRIDNVLTYSTVFACISLIANDVSKLRLRLVQQDDDGLWQETESPAFSPVLRRPNRYQNRIQFIANWITSKLIHGNTYVLKERDNRGGTAREVGVVRHLYVLDPTRVIVMCTPDGTVFYQLRSDHLSGITEELINVPASEIIHDRGPALYHPLVGVSPIMAAGLAATQGLRIQENSTRFFQNGGRPGGVITAPDEISPELAIRLKEEWNTNYAGADTGKTAVLGGGLGYQAIAMTNTDAQLIEQLQMTAETVCSAFHVPRHMVGVGELPKYDNIEALNQEYYSQCLQAHIESIELLLDEGLELPTPYGTEFDLDGLMRMDTKTKTEAARQAIQSGVSPNEVRRKYFDLGPVTGGETPYLQEQQWPLRHLAERPLPSERPVTEPEPIPPAPDEAEARRVEAIRRATRRFYELADQERANAKTH
jgi:HK97 family phage portal protein